MFKYRGTDDAGLLWKVIDKIVRSGFMQISVIMRTG